MGVSGKRVLPTRNRPPVFSETKFLAPRIRSTLVPRTELVEKLVGTDARPLTMIVGPAGTGKSSVLAEWYRNCDDGSVAWLTADRNDADPTRFWRAFIVAVQTVEPRFGVDAADAMTLDGVITPDALESMLIDDQTELSRRIRLVIDDFQFVSVDAVMQLRQLLERGLSHIRLLVGSRNEPALGLHRLRLQHDVYEMHETELRLDLDQTRQLISKMGLDPASIDLPLLHRRTQGWAAGVHLAALSALGSADPRASIRALGGNNQAIAGYLAAEVLATQPERMRRFLEDTCVVDELDEQMCEALTSRSGGAAAEMPTLAEVEAANLFLSRVDEAGTMFRYHPLFADLLRDQLRSREPVRFRDQHHFAAEACVRASNFSGAVDHYWAAGEHDVAARVINDNLLAVLYSGVRLPAIDPHVDVGTRNPGGDMGEASGYAAALLIQGRNAEARSLLDQINASETTVSVADRMHLHGLSIAAKLTLGDSTSAARAADQMIELVVSGAVPADEWISMAIPLAIKAYAWEGNFAGVDQVVDFGRPSVNPDLERADLVSSIAFAYYEEGLLTDAVRAAESARAYALASGTSDEGIDLVARAVLGCALVETAEFEAASDHLSAVLALSNTERIPMFVLASLGRARLLRADGQFDAALRTIATARGRLLSPTTTTMSSRLDELEISLHLDLGDMARAAQLATRLLPGWRAEAMKTWIAIAAGRFEDACVTIDTISDGASTPRRRLNVAIMRAHICVRCKLPGMERRVDEVLQLAEATGSVLRIAEAGSEVLQEACRVARRRPRSDFVERLLTVRPLLRPNSQVAPLYKVDELSAREVIVLQYLATSMSYQEIATALYLSINTVKTHVKNVLRKLSATSRTEAVQRATELHYF